MWWKWQVEKRPRGHVQRDPPRSRTIRVGEHDGKLYVFLRLHAQRGRPAVEELAAPGRTRRSGPCYASTASATSASSGASSRVRSSTASPPHCPQVHVEHQPGARASGATSGCSRPRTVHPADAGEPETAGSTAGRDWVVAGHAARVHSVRQDRSPSSQPKDQAHAAPGARRGPRAELGNDRRRRVLATGNALRDGVGEPVDSLPRRIVAVVLLIRLAAAQQQALVDQLVESVWLKPHVVASLLRRYASPVRCFHVSASRLS